MKVFLDTSVLVSALVESHAFNTRASPWLARAQKGEFQCFVAAHTLAETYAVLTSLPLQPKIAPNQAAFLIRENVQRSSETVTLTVSDYATTIQRMAELGWSGGVVYDALIARAAQKSDADRFMTFNPDDFKRVWPEGKAKIQVP